MAIEYRRKLGTQIWHFHRQCLLWPNRFDFVVLYNRPHDERICQECIALRHHGQHAEKPLKPQSAGETIFAEQTAGSISAMAGNQK
jgi:hypothetical protein